MTYAACRISPVKARQHVQELHEVFWEPKAAVLPSLQALLEGPPVKKLLFMTDAARIASATLPHWQVGPERTFV